MRSKQPWLVLADGLPTFDTQPRFDELLAVAQQARLSHSPLNRRMNIKGRCHCGNLSFAIETECPAAQVAPRACQCSFCRMHGARTWSDAHGTATLNVADDQQLQIYRFGLETADMWVCRICGAYAGAVLTDGGSAWSTLNLRLTELVGRDAAPVSYDDESVAERIARRKVNWTPTSVFGVSSA